MLVNDYGHRCGWWMDRGHHESDQEVRDRMAHTGMGEVWKPETPQAPKERLAVLTVSIDVTVGGYTGQRDQWEQYTEPYDVAVEGDKVTLSTRNTIPGRQITFDRKGLEAALKILEDYGR